MAVINFTLVTAYYMIHLMKQWLGKIISALLIIAVLIVGLYLRTDWPSIFPDLIQQLPEGYLLAVSYFGKADKDTYKWLDKIDLFTKDEFNQWSKYAFVYGYYSDKQIFIVQATAKEQIKLKSLLELQNWQVTQKNNQLFATKPDNLPLISPQINYTSVSLEQSGLIKINQAFWQIKTTRPELVSKLQKLLAPLSLQPTSYQVKIFQEAKSLRLKFQPAKTIFQTPTISELSKLAVHLPTKTTLALGWDRFDQATNLSFIAADLWQFRSGQDLKQLKNILRGPVLFGLSDKSWQITTFANNQDQLLNILRLDQSKFIVKSIDLPDKSPGYEMISTTSAKISTNQSSGWQILENNGLMLAKKNNILLLGKNLALEKTTIPVFTEHDLRICGINFAQELMLWSQQNKLFNKIVAAQSPNSEINFCFY